MPNQKLTLQNKTRGVAADCEQLLAEFLKNNSAFVFASLSTVDGRAFAFAGSRNTAVEQRTAAITSSFLALSESFAKEALRASCEHSMVQTNFGCIVVVRVPCKKKSHALSVSADSSQNLAMSLHLALDAAAKLAKIIDGAG